MASNPQPPPSGLRLGPLLVAAALLVIAALTYAVWPAAVEAPVPPSSAQDAPPPATQPPATPKQPTPTAVAAPPPDAPPAPSPPVDAQPSDAAVEPLPEDTTGPAFDATAARAAGEADGERHGTNDKKAGEPKDVEAAVVAGREHGVHVWPETVLDAYVDGYRQGYLQGYDRRGGR